MDAVILAAGMGRRLMPITRDLPKPLIDVAGKPLILWNIEHLQENGVERFFIVIKKKFKHLFSELLPLDKYNITFLYQDNPTGMTDAILTAKEYIIDRDFVVCAGDMIIPIDHVRDMMQKQSVQSPFGCLSLVEASIEYVPGLGNVQMGDTGRIMKIIEKPTRDELLSNLYSMPFYIFNQSIFAYLEACPLSKRGERELQDAIQQALNDQKIIIGIKNRKEFSRDPSTFKQELASLNVTDKNDYFNTNMENLKETGGIVKPKDILCTMIEPVLIKSGCTIADDCLLGPNVVIGKNVVIGALAEISNAIIQDDCLIGRKCYIENAIVMKGATIDEDRMIAGSKTDILIIE
ncbi:MAG: sugar phosphate nucleotidyltransferase [Promethearchaeota archaeon]